MLAGDETASGGIGHVVGSTGSGAVIVAIPMALRRRGVEAKLVLGGRATPASGTPDPGLVGMVGKAHRGLALPASGRAASVEVAAAMVGVDPNDLTRILPLAFLAPDITAAILNGRQPPSLTATRLRSVRPIPVDWTEQRQILGFAELATTNINAPP